MDTAVWSSRSSFSETYKSLAASRRHRIKTNQQQDLPDNNRDVFPWKHQLYQPRINISCQESLIIQKQSQSSVWEHSPCASNYCMQITCSCLWSQECISCVCAHVDNTHTYQYKAIIYNNSPQSHHNFNPNSKPYPEAQNTLSLSGDPSNSLPIFTQCTSFKKDDKMDSKAHNCFHFVKRHFRR